MGNIYYFYTFLAALFAALILVPPVSKLAMKIGGLDRPDDRKVHQHEVPRLGGVAIFCAFSLAFFVFIPQTRQTLGFFAGGLIVFLTGLADDLLCLTPRQKFLGEGIAALVAVTLGGARLESVGDLFHQGEIGLGLLAVPFTVLALVGVINAINLLDGLDGLAAGVTSIAAFVFGILAFGSGNHTLLALAVALLGGLVGFLKYNSYPARVFMGDSGSLFLGYCMGYFSVSLINGSSGRLSEMTPLIILAVPVLDTLFVMFKRYRAGQGLFSPDRTHVHHRLLGMGVGHKSTVIIVYVASYLLSAVAVLTCHLPDYVLACTLVFGTIALSGMVQAAVRLMVRRGVSVSGMIRSGRASRACRRLVGISQHLRSVIKYLAIGVLLLTFAIPRQGGFEFPAVAGLLLLLSLTLLLLTGSYANRFLLFSLYFTGAFLVFSIDNLTGSQALAGIPVRGVSHALFLVLFCVEGLEVYLRRRPGLLVSSNLEYLLLMMVVSVPLMPAGFLARYQLLSVVGKSVILFIAYKLVLMRRPKNNRKLILATQLALLACVAKPAALALLACAVLYHYLSLAPGPFGAWPGWRALSWLRGRSAHGQVKTARRPSEHLPAARLAHPSGPAQRSQLASAARVLSWFRLRDGEFDERVAGHQVTRAGRPQGQKWQEGQAVSYRKVS